MTVDAIEITVAQNSQSGSLLKGQPTDINHFRRAGTDVGSSIGEDDPGHLCKLLVASHVVPHTDP